jgi:hypothetical protein
LDSRHGRVPVKLVVIVPVSIEEPVVMIQTLEAVIDPQGRVSLLRPARFTKPHRALVTVLDEDPAEVVVATGLSEPALSVDWNRAEEEAAWAHLQPAK